jgi:modulator of FtsH protease HflK
MPTRRIADKERLRQEAEAYASGIIPVAEGQASRQMQEAEGYKAQVVAIAEGEAARFTQLQAAYERRHRA